MCPLVPFSIYRNANLKPQMLAFPSKRTSIDIPVLLSLVSLSPLLLSDLYLSLFHLGLTSLETDGQLFPVFVLYDVDILEYS